MIVTWLTIVTFLFLCNRVATRRVEVQYSVDFGRTWSLLQRRCSFEDCKGRYWGVSSIYDVSNLGKGWRRVILPLPASALTQSTRFRWKASALNFKSQWALDNIYIGADTSCPRMCRGHGYCSTQGCRCDPGYSGSSCDVTQDYIPTFLSEDFNSGSTNSHFFEQPLGGDVNFDCGIVGSGRSLVFNRAGRRRLISKQLNASELRFLQFTILIGRYPSTGKCKSSSPPKEGVVVQYSTNNGILWKFLHFISTEALNTPRIITLRLPSDASVVGLQLIWSQSAENNLENEAVWAIDDVLVTPNLFKTANSTSVSFYVGRPQAYCNRSLALVFTPNGSDERSMQYAETQTFQISQGYLLQAEVVMRCGESTGLNTTLQLQFSTNHGRSWRLINELSLPGSSSSQPLYHEPSVLYSSEFQRWRIVTIPLPPGTWSSGTRFRIAQRKSDANAGTWAIDDVYIGPSCPMFCRGHGKCRNGNCKCDPGYHGDECLPSWSLPVNVEMRFDDVDSSTASDWLFIGGRILNEDDATKSGCGPMMSSKYLHFSDSGPRKLESPDMDTRRGGRIEFYLRISGVGCGKAHNRSNGVFLQSSVDGGVTWVFIQEFYYSAYYGRSYVHLDIPPTSQRQHIRFRWWQPQNKGAQFDQWSIDDIIIGENRCVTRINVPTGLVVQPRAIESEFNDVTRIKKYRFVALSNQGGTSGFCSPKADSYYFNGLHGDRIAMTEDLHLSEGDILQFQINIACSEEFSYKSPVVLEYSHDSGFTWDLLRHNCYPRGKYLLQNDDKLATSYVCSGAEKSLRESSRYYQGDYGQWTSVVIPLSADVTARPVRFRWMQKVPLDGSSDTAADWSLSNIYIGSSCPDYCSGHGLCTNIGEETKCFCDRGYFVNSDGSCSPFVPVNKEGFRDRFDQSSSVWKRPHGGAVEHGYDNTSSNNVLYFSGEGTRRAETKSLNTRNLRFIHFYLQVGGSGATPHDRNENIIFQYSLDNGITWKLIKEYSSLVFNKPRPQLVMLDLPFRAKSRSTSFRWWQPLQSRNSLRSSWSIGDVIVGRDDMFDNGFYEDFESENNTERLSEKHWYSLRGGRLGRLPDCFVTSSSLVSLIFDSREGQPRFVETWDFYVFPGSFIQFDLIMGCRNHGNDAISLEFSNDLGISWGPVVPQCLPGSDVKCDVGFGTTYFEELNQKWRRHTVAIPVGIRNQPIRFRWIQHFNTGSYWAIDNFYLGNDCAWMCSGFGHCVPNQNGKDFACRCDEGFDRTPYCQPSIVLPSALRDDFNHPWAGRERFGLIVGTKQNTTSIDVMINRQNLEFSSAGMRILQTLPINTTDTRYVQFYIRFKTRASRTENREQVIVQASINNGIFWKTMDVLEDHFDGKDKFIHIKLAPSLRHTSTIFRWLTMNTDAETNAAWAIDNLVIGGSAEYCDADHIKENFSSFNEENWLFHSGGTIVDVKAKKWIDGASLRSANTPDAEDYVMTFFNETGEHSLVTRDLCISRDNYVIQFMMWIGSSKIDAATNPVRFETTMDDGVTWELVVPHCFADRGRGAGCSGPQCDDVCNGHGVCEVRNLTCTCDEGYEGNTCCDVTDGTNPTFFIETFSSRLRPIAGMWEQLAGGHVTFANCDAALGTSRGIFSMTKPGSRIAMTRDIDTRGSRFIQFFLRQENNWKSEEDQIESDAVYLQYSTDGGLTWGVMDKFDFQNQRNDYVVLVLPETAKNGATRFRWWEPSTSGNFTSNWGLSHVIVGRDLTEIDDIGFHRSSFTTLASSAFTTINDSRCCSRDQSCSLVLIGGSEISSRDCGHRWLSTVGVRVVPGTFLHFSLTSDCQSELKTCHALHLEYSVNLGRDWALVKPPCLTNEPLCGAVGSGSIYVSDQFRETRRVVVVLPASTRSSSTRLRWKMPNGMDATTWALNNIYVGDRCQYACSGRGWCHNGTCRCDEGWRGPRCQHPVNSLPTEWKDVFEDEEEISNNYVLAAGAVVDISCGNMGFDKALHFVKNCSRVLITHQMDTTGVDFVQFYFRYGCTTRRPTNRDQGVFLDFTLNRGITWKPLMELYYNEFNETRFVNVLMPESAKGIGVQLRWWQPQHDDMEDWAIDNLAIGGGKEGKFLSDQFDVGASSSRTFFLPARTVKIQAVNPVALNVRSIFPTNPKYYHLPRYMDRGDVDMWLFYDNFQQSNYCGRDDVILAGIQPYFDVSLTTKDFIASPGYILQYTIVVGCHGNMTKHEPVHVQYSTDYGDSWTYVTSQCIPSNADCYGKEMTQPSAHFISSDWRRRTIRLSEALLGRSLRFRFYQKHSDVRWGVDKVYIGPDCPDSCLGHGDCVMKHGGNRCVCDEGYTDDNCVSVKQRKTFLKDTFDMGLNTSQWNILDSAHPSIECGTLIDGLALVFSGIGPKQAETADMDLRDARFVQYYARIGARPSSSCLLPQTRSDGIILQYSIDGGTSWVMIRDLDYLSYPNSTHDYIRLPVAARSNSSRLRWWQPFAISAGLVSMGEDRASWALDDVYVGGHEVNAPVLDDAMQVPPAGNLGSLPDESFDFHPNGVIRSNTCNSLSRVITWSGGVPTSIEQSLTTRQLIVSRDYMIQFKIKVGCSPLVNVCPTDFAVRLEYRTHPLGDWSLVREDCFPDSTITATCSPFVHHQASVYNPQTEWERVTIPLDDIGSGTVQFRWYQQGGSPIQYSWALDDIYIGQACPEYCSGHGKCTRGATCVCDEDFLGPTCSRPLKPVAIQNFEEDFEPDIVNPVLLAMKPRMPIKWKEIEGGDIGNGGCGFLGPYGFGQTAYFHRCGRRWIQTVELDLRKGRFVQYVIQIGMLPPRSSCRVSSASNMTRSAAVLLEYSVNNGVTWRLLEEHKPLYFVKPKRVALQLKEQVQTIHTTLRWWQPHHGGAGNDQWALDNIEIITERGESIENFS